MERALGAPYMIIDTAIVCSVFLFYLKIFTQHDLGIIQQLYNIHEVSNTIMI